MGQLLRMPAAERRDFREVELMADLVVVGGGVSGTCCAIAAARAGARVVLVQDRPVLGGNASSEVRLWILGATAHGHVNNRWSREGGVLDEILVENLYRNREGNAVIFDTLLLEKVTKEPNITLLLNTAVLGLEKRDSEIESVIGFCSQNSTRYRMGAALFCDASGDGVVGFLSGAAFRLGAEDRDEFGELFAPSEEYGSLMGHSIFFYTKDLGKPTRFKAPAYALNDISRIPRYRSLRPDEQGCQLWWIEYGGRLDTVHDSESIKWELWRIVYGVWDHLKNSGRFPEAENLTLEWVGLIPGKRESRRFEGEYVLTQRDIVERKQHDDAVAHGGWAIDLHHADGAYSGHSSGNLIFPEGVYQIPYRCLYSKDVPNLFLAGRLISASHVAFGSTRVMGTCGAIGQAVGAAAALCAREELRPAKVVDGPWISQLQQDLLWSGQHIPGVKLNDPSGLARSARVFATSEFLLGEFPADGPALPLTTGRAQMVPIVTGQIPQFTVTVDVNAPTVLQTEIRTGDRPDSYTPGHLLAVQEIPLDAGAGQRVKIDAAVSVSEARYVFFCLSANDHVAVRATESRVTGVLAVRHRDTQEADASLGRPHVEFWTPERRPAGHNFACTLEPAVRAFVADNVKNGYNRPTSGPNAWVAALEDQAPALTFSWEIPQRIQGITLCFDSDFDHPMETILWSHPEDVVPFCVRTYRVLAGPERKLVAECIDNHQTQNAMSFEPPLETDELVFEFAQLDPAIPVSVFEVRFT